MGHFAERAAVSLQQVAEELLLAEQYCRKMRKRLSNTPRYAYSGRFYALRSSAEKAKEAAMTAERNKAEQAYNAANAYREDVLQYALKLKHADPDKAGCTFWFDSPFGEHDGVSSDGNPKHFSFPKGRFLEKRTLRCSPADLDYLRSHSPDFKAEVAYSNQTGEYYYTLLGLRNAEYIDENNLLYRDDALLARDPAEGIRCDFLYLINIENKSLSYQTFDLDGVKEFSDSWALASESAAQRLEAQYEQIEHRISQRRSGLSMDALDMFGTGMISLSAYNDWAAEKNQGYNQLAKKYREARDRGLREYMQRSSAVLNREGSVHTRTHLSRGGAAVIGYIGDELAFIELIPDAPLEEMDIPAGAALETLGDERYNYTVSKAFTGCDLVPVLRFLAGYYGPLMGPFDLLEPKPIKWLPDWLWRLYCEERMILQERLNELTINH